MSSANHMPPRLQAILSDHSRGPEYALVECIESNCEASSRQEFSFGRTDFEIQTIFEKQGWTVRPTLCPTHSHRIVITDKLVTKSFGTYPGTAANCSCGWKSEWTIRDGSAESDAARHREEVRKRYGQA